MTIKKRKEYSGNKTHRKRGICGYQKLGEGWKGGLDESGEKVQTPIYKINKY